MVAFVHQKGFRLIDDIRVYNGEAMETETLSIQARHMIEFSAAYDIIEPDGGQIGTIQRKGWSSIIIDDWEILNHRGREVARVLDTSPLIALLKRYSVHLANPSGESGVPDGRVVGEMEQRFTPFSFTLDIDLTSDPRTALDRRLAMAAAIIIAVTDRNDSD
jgi:hypothetical protein